MQAQQISQRPSEVNCAYTRRPLSMGNPRSTCDSNRGRESGSRRSSFQRDLMPRRISSGRDPTTSPQCLEHEDDEPHEQQEPPRSWAQPGDERIHCKGKGITPASRRPSLQAMRSPTPNITIAKMDTSAETSSFKPFIKWIS